MKADRRPDAEPMLTPESAVWMLYAGLVQGLRWRRHLASRPVVATARPPRLRGPAPR